MEFRQSMLNVLKNGLLCSGRTTFLHRILYVGELKMERAGLEDFMTGLVSTQSDLPREEGLTGVLVVYNHNFIHLVEGSESTLRKHLRGVVHGDLDSADQIGAVKVVLEIAHISKRCVGSWSSRAATPPTLASQLKSGAVSVAETARYADAVLSKTLRVVEALKKLPAGAPLSQQMALQLPEAELVEALLASPLVRDVRVLLEEQRVPPTVRLYDDEVWPMQSDFVPYNLLEQPIEVLREQSQADADGLQDADEEDGAGTEDDDVEVDRSGTETGERNQ